MSSSKLGSSVPRKKSKWDDDDDDEPKRPARPPKKAKKSALSGVALSTTQSPAPSPRREHLTPVSGSSTQPASPGPSRDERQAAAGPVPSSSRMVQDERDGARPRQRRIRDLHPPIVGCRSVYCYERLNHIEEGSYGVVFRARDKETGDIVALKKIKMDQEKNGFPITSLREIHTLMVARHENIVRVREIVVGDTLTQIFIVMDFIEHDLKTLLATMRTPFLASEIKTILLQLLSATALCHENWIVHRDLKTSNLLMNNRGQIKVADFGLARMYSDPLGHMTPLVVTLWYRAPELLLGAKEYSTAIDMWSVGCIFAELILKEPLFAGKGEIDQVGKIFKLLGRPTDEVWPGFSKLPNTSSFNTASIQPYSTLRQKFRFVTDAGIDLMNRLLTYDPEKRITADEAMKHPYFSEAPLPKHSDAFQSFPSIAGGEKPKLDSPAAPTRGAGGGAAQYDLIL